MQSDSFDPNVNPGAEDESAQVADNIPQEFIEDPASDALPCSDPDIQDLAEDPIDGEPDDFEDDPSDDYRAPARALYRGSRTGTLIFYTLYILLILVFGAAIALANSSLKAWLTDYQLSQPTDKRDQVFAEFFAEPDWYAVYEAAGIEDTEFEGSEAFVTYMDALVGNSPLEMVETSAGLSGNRKYFIKLGQQSIASFLLQSEPDPITGLNRWKLGDLDVFFSRNVSVTVLIQQGQTAYINGVPLNDSHTVRVDSTLAPQYLPVGIYPHRSYTLQLSGLLTEPEVTVLDERGAPVSVTHDPDTGNYRTDAPAFPEEIPQEALKAVVTALRTYGDYLLGEAETDALLAHFDRTTDVWPVLLAEEPFDQEAAVYEYVKETVTGYRQYASDLFSVQVEITFLATLNADEEEAPDTGDEPKTEEHTLSHTLIFRHTDNRWVCIGAADETDLAPASRVLIRFVMDGVVVSDNFHDTGLRELVVPLVSAPEGRVFAGWYREQTAEDGSITLIPVFCPDESGLVRFSDDFILNPMTLYALFEDNTTETEVTE